MRLKKKNKEVINSDDEREKKSIGEEKGIKKKKVEGRRKKERNARGEERPRPPTYRVLQEQMFPSSTEFRHGLIDS